MSDEARTGAEDELPNVAALPIAGRPNGEQALLLRAIWNGFIDRKTWPTFDYVERTMYGQTPGQGLNAQDVILGCPWIVRPHGMSAYGWVWSSSSSPGGLNPGDIVGLTVAGMYALPDGPQYQFAHDSTRAFLWALAAIVRAELAAAPDPQSVVHVQVPQSEIAEWLPSELHAHLAVLKEVLDREPPTVRRVRTLEPTKWAVDPERTIRCYYGADSVEKYLRAVAQAIAPPVLGAPAVASSSLALPEAIDYLNEVWHRRAKGPLFDIRRADAAAKCALGCASKDEFDSRLSAVSEILAHVRLPGFQLDMKLVHLEQGIGAQLPDDAAGRAREAVVALRQVVALRTWRQHSGSDLEKRAREAMARVGVQLPTHDWGSAWERIQAFAVGALNALREEVELVNDIGTFGGSVESSGPAHDAFRNRE